MKANNVFKKFLGVLVCFVIVLGVTGCGNDLGVADIVDNTGETKKLKAEELATLYEENEAKFKKYYTGAKINVTGTIESIEEDSETPTINGQIKFIDVYEITLSEGWIVTVDKQDNEDLIAELEKGDKLLVESEIAMGWNGVSVQLHCVNGFGTNADFNGIGWPEYEYPNNTIIKKVD